MMRTCLLVFVALAAAAAGEAQVLPALPQTILDTSYPPMAGQSIIASAGGSLQSAINAAQPGDTILLQPGATYVGPFTLPVKSGSGWIVIRTSAADSSLPPEGTRITPAYASALPKLAAPAGAPAVRTVAGSHRFRLMGIEIILNTGVTTNDNLVQFGDGGTAQDTVAEVPYELVLDRVYMHGTVTASLRRGVALNCASCAVIDSHISDVHQVGPDTQAIAGWNGPGPIKIVNNYLEASGENIIFGGGDPSIPNLVPSDIEMRRNHLFKPLTWNIGHPTYAGTAWTVKNLFELKNARRVLVDANVFENNWEHAQNGFAILFTPRNQDGTAPWSVVEDVTFRNNIVRHVAGAMNILGRDNINMSQQTARILIRNNLVDDVGGAAWGGTGRLFQVVNGTLNVTIDHNTGIHTSDAVVGDSAPNVGFVYRNNLTPNNLYGVGGTGTFGSPLATLSTYYPGAQFVRNVLAGGNPALYPLDNFFPATLADVRFVDLVGHNYRLQTISPYKNAGTDGKDIGADFDALEAAGGPPPGVPTLFSATASSTTEVQLTWAAVAGATSYEVERASMIGAFTPALTTSSTSPIDSGLTSDTTYIYRVRATGPGGTSPFSTVDVATTIIFTDSSLDDVVIKAVHITQLRTAVNAMRVAADVPAVTFTDNSLPGTIIKRVHIIELRESVNAARSAIGIPAVGYTDPTITAGVTTVKAAHIKELRASTQ